MVGELLLWVTQEVVSHGAGGAWEGFLRTRRFLRPAPRAALARAGEVAYHRAVLACLDRAADIHRQADSFTIQSKNAILGVRPEIVLRLKRLNGDVPTPDLRNLVLDKTLSDALSHCETTLLSRALGESSDDVYASVVQEHFLEEIRAQVLKAIGDDEQAQQERLEVLMQGLQERLRGGEAHLDLRWPDASPTRDGSPNALFHASARLIKFEERGGELALLRAWLDSTDRFGGAFILGDGGTGKTRLALEIVREQLLKAEGYDAGLLSARALSTFVNHPNMAHWRPEHDTLIVVDYAAAHIKELQALVPFLADICGRNEGPRVRILLLDRLAEDAGARLNTLFSRDSALQSTARWLSVKLSQEEIKDPAAWTQNIVRATLARLREQGIGTASESPTFSATDVAAITAATELRPLYLQLLAYQIAELGGAQIVGRLSRAQLLNSAVEREKKHLSRKFPNASPEEAATLRAISIAYALVTLRRGVSPHDTTFFSAVAQFAGVPHLDPSALAEWLRLINGTFRQDGEERLLPLEPDGVGSAFAARILGELPTIAAGMAIVLSGQSLPVWDRVRLMIDDLAPLEVFPPVADWLEAYIMRADMREVSRARAFLPRPSLRWARWRLALEQRGAALATASLKKDGENQKQSIATLATALNNWSVELGDAGNMRDALSTILRAKTLCSELAKTEPVVYGPLFAMILNNCANRLSDVGQLDEALVHAQESLEIRRELATKDPDAYGPHLATSLNNYANRLNDVGRRDEALAHAQESLRIWRRLAKINPEDHIPNLALSLNNCANMFRDVGRRDEAIAHAKESLEIRRILAKKNPDAYEPDLATILNNFSNLFLEDGRRNEALIFAQESLGIWRRLAKNNPDVYEPDLATSLNNYANMLNSVGRRSEALDYAQESLEIRRKLAKANPSAYEPSFATTLSNYANVLNEMGRLEEALSYAQESLQIRRRLAEIHPDAYEPALAMILSNYANTLNSVGRKYEALTHAQESLGLRRKLAKINPDAYEPDLAMVLNNYSGLLASLGQRDDALRHALECLEIRRKLASTNPGAYESDLASVLNNYANLLNSLGERDEALKHAQEGLRIWQRLVKANPNAFEPNLAKIHGTIGHILVALERSGDASQSFEEGLRTILPSLRVYPRAFSPLAVMLLRGYAQSCKASGLKLNWPLIQAVISA